jgi:hypothetical protein
MAPPVKHMHGFQAYDLLKQLESTDIANVDTEKVQTLLKAVEQELEAILAMVNEEISLTGKKIAG